MIHVLAAGPYMSFENFSSVRIQDEQGEIIISIVAAVSAEPDRDCTNLFCISEVHFPPRRIIRIGCMRDGIIRPISVLVPVNRPIRSPPPRSLD